MIEKTFCFNSVKGGMTSVQAVRAAIRNSCRWSTKLIDVLNNKSSSPFMGYNSCIHKKRFKRPKKGRGGCIIKMNFACKSNNKTTGLKRRKTNSRCQTGIDQERKYHLQLNKKPLYLDFVVWSLLNKPDSGALFIL